MANKPEIKEKERMVKKKKGKERENINNTFWKERGGMSASNGTKAGYT